MSDRYQFPLGIDDLAALYVENELEMSFCEG
jgi:hypothetical protein